MTGRILDQASRVQTQYASDSGAHFYRIVMGDGGSDIHYGIYKNRATSVKAATEAASLRLLEIAEQNFQGERLREVVDLGSGSGGSARLIALKRGARVSCVDLCERLHCENRRRASECGIAEKIETWDCSYDRLPTEWSGRFDMAWSQDAICHAAKKEAVFGEAFRVLREGGVFVFSDVMLAEQAPAEEAAAFTGVNAVVQLGKQDQYLRNLRDIGFVNVCFEDWTPHLTTNFARMRHQIELYYVELIEMGVAPEFVDNFADALDRRLKWATGSVMRWGAFVGSKASQAAENLESGG